MFNANVLDFQYVVALSNYGAICLRHGMKNGANFGFFSPRSFQGALGRNRYSKGSVEY